MTSWYPFVSHFKTASLSKTISSLKLSDLSLTLQFFFVAESLLFWRLQTSYSRVYNPKEICCKKHITVLTDDFAWIPSIESTSKSLSSECLMCHVFRVIRRGNWSARLSEFNRQCSFFHIIVFWKLATFSWHILLNQSAQCSFFHIIEFWKLATFSWHILLNQSAFLNHFFMTLTFSFTYNFFFFNLIFSSHLCLQPPSPGIPWIWLPKDLPCAILPDQEQLFLWTFLFVKSWTIWTGKALRHHLLKCPHFPGGRNWV